MVSRRHRARFFSKAALHGFSRLTRRKHKASPFRYVFLILLTLGSLSAWSFGGGQFMASLNPNLRMQFHLFKPALDAWITPPEYAGLSPVLIATPAGARYGGSVISVLAGSTLTAHLADGDGGTPVLVVNGEETAFNADANGGFEIAKVIESGDSISIRRGWQEMNAWQIKVLPHDPPHVAFTSSPVVTDRKTVQFSYNASDAFGVASVVARITPEASSSPRSDNVPVDIVLATPAAKDVNRVSFEDLTAYPWAGSPVRIQLIATNLTGQKTESAAVDFTPPARVFTNLIAHALVVERDKLLKAPEDGNVRNEIANVMAEIANLPATFRADPVVAMTLRSGAVRLVLGHGPETVAPVGDLLWQAAVRIEDGSIGIAERRLRDVQGELAEALDHKAPAGEVQGLIDRLREALASYMAALSARPAHAEPPENISQVSGIQTNRLTPQDTEKMLQDIRDLSIGSPTAARDELLQLGQQIEGLRGAALSAPVSFAEDMRRRAHNLAYPAGNAHDAAERATPAF